MSAVPATFTHDQCRALQMALNEKTRSRLFVDGDIGPKTVTQLKIYQGQCAIPVTGEYDEKTNTLLGAFMEQKYLHDSDYGDAANQLGCDKAAVMAVVDVEAAGDGFLPDGRCDILFERHKFFQAIEKKYGTSKAKELQSQHPTICNPESGGYAGNEGEYPRLAVAEAIDAECAAASASWGMFQIMGFHFALCGYPSAVAFSEAMKASERNQLKAFVAFVKSQTGMLAALRARDWTTLARLYNGPKYYEHKYDTRLATAYATHK